MVPQDPPGDQSNGLAELVVRVGTAIVGGVGVIGLGTFVGGAILFMRFEAARLPTEEAVAVVPKSIMLTIGASVLVPLTFALVLALVVVRAAIVKFGRRLHLEEKDVRSDQVKQGVFGLAFVIPGVLIYYWVAIHAVRFESQTLLIVAIAAVGVLICAVVGMPQPGDRQWVWFGLTVMLVIAGAATGITWVRTYGSPEVRPAALIRTGGDGGMAGLFIAETSDRVYLARVGHTGDRERGEPGTGRLVSIPLDQVAGLEVGVNTDLSQALTQAPQLLSELRLCRSPARNCASDLTIVQPGFDPNLPVPLMVATVRLGARHQWSIALQNTATFAILADSVRITAVRRIRRPGGHIKSETLVLGASTRHNHVPAHGVRMVSLVAGHTAVLLGTHPAVRRIRVVVALTAPSGTRATISTARHAAAGGLVFQR